MKKDIKELKNVLTERLYEVSKFWSDCDDNYQNLKEFIPSINALIQSIRNITLIIQNYKSIIPNFDDWYGAKQKEMGKDTLLRWVYDARVTIVHISNLKLKSKTKIDLLNWETHPIQSIEMDPLTENIKIINTLLAKESVKDLIIGLREPLIRIKRYWVADNLPDKELLWVTAYCYRYFKEMLIELFKITDIDTSNITTNFEKNPDILDKITLFENKRTAIFDLKDFKKFSKGYEKISANDKKLEKIANKRYGTKQPDYLKKEDKILNHFEFVTEKAKQLIEIDGHHAPMFFLFNKDLKLKIISPVYRDRTELYYAMYSLADEILKNKNIGVVLVLESWLKDLSFKNIGECVEIIVIKKDYFCARIIPFVVENKKTILKEVTEITNKADFPGLKPIIEAIDGV